MDIELNGKTVIVTGGGSNIGRAIVLAFAREGANIIIADIDEVQAQKVCSLVAPLGGAAMHFKTDVTRYDQVEMMVGKVLDVYKKIDVLVNNVGWDQIPNLTFIKTPREVWGRSIDINYRAVLNTTSAVLPHMIERKSGAIVNLSSEAGRIGQYGAAVYSGSKAAVIGFSKAMARELGRYGIRVNVVCPGLTVPENKEEVGEASAFGRDALNFVTEDIEKISAAYPLRKLGKPADVAAMVVTLASSVAAGNITGQAVSISGGFSMV